MNLNAILKNRYSTKQFDPERTLTTAQIEEIKALLRFSPSSVNLQPWHFILADTAAGKAEVAKGTTEAYRFNTQKILDSALSVVFCVRRDVDEDYLINILEAEARDGRFPDPSAQAMTHNTRQNFVNLHAQERQDLPHWMENQLYLNMGAFLLGVAVMGLDAVAMEGVDTEALDRTFDLPARGYRAVAVVSVGYHADDDFNADLPKSRLPENELFTVLPA